MSILCGLLVRVHRLNGSSYHEKMLYECTDLKDACAKVREAQKSYLQWKNMIARAELHDTDNGRTWSVDDEGISHRDYHYENTDRFRKRWMHKWQRH